MSKFRMSIPDQEVLDIVPVVIFVLDSLAYRTDRKQTAQRADLRDNFYKLQFIFLITRHIYAAQDNAANTVLFHKRNNLQLEPYRFLRQRQMNVEFLAIERTVPLEDVIQLRKEHRGIRAHIPIVRIL